MSLEDGCTSCGRWWYQEDSSSSPPPTPPGTPLTSSLTSGNGNTLFHCCVERHQNMQHRFSMEETATIGGRSVSVWKMKQNI